MPRFLPLAALLITAACTRGRVNAAIISLPARADATILENNPHNGSGRSTGLFAGTNGASSPRRALIAFDLSAIPAGAIIESVQLTLYLGQVAGSGGGTPGGGVDVATIGLHRIAAAWGEGETQLRSPPSDSFVGIGQGAPAEDDDVTWNDRFAAADPPAQWTQPGGDFGATASATLTIGRTLNIPYAWPSTAVLVADVQYWLTNPALDFGWILVNLDESSRTTFRALYSRDAATAAFHPSLTVSYSTPTITADFDGDVDVDGADLLTWQRNLGTSAGGTRSMGDANGDGAISAADLAAWRQGFGASSAAWQAAPEPSVAKLIVLSLIALFGLRRS